MENAGTLTVGAPRHDPERLQESKALRPRGAADKAVYDRLTALVTALLDVPISLLSIVTRESQELVSVAGIGDKWVQRGEISATRSFCQHAVLSGAALAIDDARSHPLAREASSILDVDVVAYLGVPLETAAGDTIGSFCAIDLKPRSWSEADVRILSDLAATVTAHVEARPPAAEPRQRGLNIAAVARRTGIAADTLRKWERRYGVLQPQRTAGGQRRYDELDVSRIEWLRDRLGEGFRIGAAALLLEPVGADSAAGVEDLRDALVEAARACDPLRLADVVEQTFTLHPAPLAIEEVVAPALRAVGETWESDLAAIGEEHLLSEAIRSRFERILSDRRAGVRGKLVLACAPGERHELGLLGLGVALQADGWLVAYLGADVPTESTLSLAERLGADAVCISATMPDALERLASDLRARAGDDLAVVAGGQAVGEAIDLPARIVTGGLTNVVTELRSV